ncbi:MAG: 3-hydroxyacyl-CoA dehydrogenase NAD-binding domain-containing protein [Steroidobacteraceae bacterium]
MSFARYRRDGVVAVVELNHPPLNALSHELRTAIAAAVDKAVADEAVKAIVLIGNDRAFSSGADIREFETPKALAEPNLDSLNSVVEGCPKPVVAAIAGACMGGGLELALSCHFRVTLGDAKIAFPEVKLGLVPGAGGTQRFPRLVGLELAANLIASGNTVPAKMLKGTRLFDEIVTDDLLPAAIAFAKRVVKDKQPIVRVRDLTVDYPQADAYLHFARTGAASVSKGMPAPARCVDAVAAAVNLPFDQGLAAERTIFRELMITPESKALRYSFFAQRAASKIPDVPESTLQRPVKSVAVLGAGTMGGGIAMNFANAGIPVYLLELKADALERGIATIRKNYESSAKKGRLSTAQVEERMGLIKPTLEYKDIASVDLAIEAVFEDIEVKRQVFSRLDATLKRGAILATNTSTLDVNQIAKFTKRPKDVVGMHFFSPANVMKLLEIVRGKLTAKDVLATVMATAKKIGKTGVVSGVCDGFIGNRMIEQYSRQAMFMLEEGASPQQVDRVIEKFGFAMGPFRMSDLAGNDIGWHIRKRRYVEQPQLKYSSIADKICELGRFGQKTGSGWYRYEPGRRDALPDVEVEEIIAAERRELGIKPRKISEAEIVDRLVYALVNEGAQILAERIAQRPSDIDIVYLTGYGFPVYKGGPMFHADQVGLFNVVRRMREFAANPHGDPGFWQPAPLLLALQEHGKKIADAHTVRAKRATPANRKSPRRTRAVARKTERPNTKRLKKTRPAKAASKRRSTKRTRR